MIVIVSIVIVIIIPIVHTHVYQLRCYRHQYIDTSLLTEYGRRPLQRPWRFSIGETNRITSALNRSKKELTYRCWENLFVPTTLFL